MCQWQSHALFSTVVQLLWLRTMLKRSRFHPKAPKKKIITEKKKKCCIGKNTCFIYADAETGVSLNSPKKTEKERKKWPNKSMNLTSLETLVECR